MLIGIRQVKPGYEQFQKYEKKINKSDSSSSISSVYFPSKYHSDSFYNTEKGKNVKKR